MDTDKKGNGPPRETGVSPLPIVPTKGETPVSQVGDELGAVDDAVIGRAVRWSVLALVVIGAAVAGAIVLAHRKPPAPPSHITQISAPVVPQRAQASVPVTAFTNITSAAGIDFVHNNGAYGEKLLPETMGCGVAVFDYDNDGAQDLLFINATYWPGHVPGGSQPTTMRLYHNEGHGHFTDVTAGSGLDVPFYGVGVAVGDYDNDGLVDVFVTGVGEYHLFHNEGRGHFHDVTKEAGIAASQQDWGTSAAFFDYDNDGKLDLFVCNYVRWSRDIDFGVNYTLGDGKRAYGPPMNFPGSFCKLYHNDGNGRFSDVSEKAGIQVKNADTGVPAGKSLGVVPIDLDGDGYVDLVVANDTVPNFVFHNQRNGTFKEIGFTTGMAFDPAGVARGAMGIDAARFRNDDSLGIGIGNFANEMVALYVSHGSRRDDLIFTDDAIAEGVGPVSRLPLKFGLFFFDYDLDGWLDLLTANGHIEEAIGKFQHGMTYAQPAQLFWNAGATSGRFIPVGPDKAGAGLFHPIVGRGSAFADLDGDGDLDVVFMQVGGPPVVLRNDQKLGHHFLRLKLVGTTCNRDAIGATVKVRVNGRTQWRQVMPTRSYLSQSELPVTIGLGSAARPESIEIIWPGGSTQKLDTVACDRLVTITQPR
jgi:hypothetical protein